MKKLIFKYWYVLPIVQTVLMLTLCVLFTTVPTVFEFIVSILLILTLIAIVVSFVVLLVNKQWLKAINLFLISTTVFIVLGVIMSMLSLSAPDGFGRRHPIPENLKYNKPLGCIKPDGDTVDFGPDGYMHWERLEPAIDTLDKTTWLQIWIGFQGGIYDYDFYYTALPAGDIFLRCYEVTENIPLSEERLAEKSVSIDSTFEFSKLVDKKMFTIYEGDWKDYYAARIEVWHRDRITKKERKLLEKIYRVDGWTR